MKYSFLGMALIMGGLIGIIFISMFQSITIDNEAEYYVLKEAMEAAMLESVDKVCYRNNSEESKQNGCGKVIKITEQKFVENFTRRFAASINGDIYIPAAGIFYDKPFHYYSPIIVMTILRGPP